jgi:thioesterase domain-containing protein
VERELARVLAEELPITQSLGITVREVTPDRVVLALPLRANRNHKGTLFAGSLNAVATLAGWSVVWAILQEAGVPAHAVIQDSSVRYLAPAGTDVTAEATRPDRATTERALAMLVRRGRARLGLEAVVRDSAGEVVATLQGRYVMHRFG